MASLIEKESRFQRDTYQITENGNKKKETLSNAVGKIREKDK